MNYYELLIRRHLMQNAPDGESGLQLRITSSETIAGCAQLYSLTSGDSSLPPNKIGNTWTFTGVTDSAWTIKIQYKEVGPNTEIIISKDGAGMYHTVVSREWVDLADVVSNISFWMDSNTSSTVNMTLTVVSGDAGGGESGGSATITVTGFGEQTWQKFNTTYQLSGDGSYWDGDGVLIRYDVRNGSNCWIFLADGETDLTFAPYILSNNSDPMSIIGTQRSDNIYETYNTLTITLVSGGSGDNSSGGGTNTDVIIISGCGTPEWDGTYTRTSGEWTGTDNIRYTSSSGKILQMVYEGGGLGYAWTAQVGTSPPAYISEGFNDVSELPTVGWYSGPMGTPPFPTVTFGG